MERCLCSSVLCREFPFKSIVNMKRERLDHNIAVVGVCTQTSVVWCMSLHLWLYECH